MLQFYFLSILCNGMAGLLLCADYLGRRLPRLGWLQEKLVTRRSRMAWGVAAVLVGLCTLFWPVGSGVPVVGDLLPSVACLAMGVALLFEVFRQDALYPEERRDREGHPVIDWRAFLGFTGLVVAILHFFLPERVLL